MEVSAAIWCSSCIRDVAGQMDMLTGPGGKVWDFTCDNGGRIMSYTRPNGMSTHFTYAGDLPVKIDLDGVVDQDINIEYNNFFEPVTMTYAGSLVNYTYDDDGLLLSANDITVTRSASSGRVNAVGDGTASIAFGYSGFSEVDMVNTTVNSIDAATLILTHHPQNRRITAKSEMIAGVTTNYQYTYDGLGRLTSVSDGSGILESYTYDVMGRRTSADGAAYTYNTDDQLLSAGGTAAYDYSVNGYRTFRYTDTTTVGYEYTAAGQLVGVRQYVDDNGDWVLDVNAPEVTYQLDAAGRRVSKLVDGVVDEKYLWAGHNTTLLAVYDENNALEARFEYGVGRMPIRMTQDGSTYYFAYDQVGSLRAVFDDTGALVHEITYDSYGNILSETNSSLCVPFGFAGGLHDCDTGIVLFGFRDYDPETGTWLTPDPIGFAGGDVYLYGYCGGDPVNWVDPLGMYELGAWWGGFTSSITETTLNCMTFGYIGKNPLQQAQDYGGWTEFGASLAVSTTVGAIGSTILISAGPITAASFAARATFHTGVGATASLITSRYAGNDWPTTFVNTSFGATLGWAGSYIPTPPGSATGFLASIYTMREQLYNFISGELTEIISKIFV